MVQYGSGKRIAEHRIIITSGGYGKQEFRDKTRTPSHY